MILSCQPQQHLSRTALKAVAAADEEIRDRNCKKRGSKSGAWSAHQLVRVEKRAS
jgi:hypothetical protein